MKYLKKDFLSDVKAEAEAIKLNATKNEIKKLSFEKLDPEDFGRCIYGQMTGDCRTIRAAKLIQACCKRFVVSRGNGEFRDFGFRAVKNQVNGSTVDDFFYKRSDFKMDHFSSIEAYILLPKAKNKNLIAYIKGETDKLVF